MFSVIRRSADARFGVHFSLSQVLEWGLSLPAHTAEIFAHFLQAASTQSEGIQRAHLSRKDL